MTAGLIGILGLTLLLTPCVVLDVRKKKLPVIWLLLFLPVSFAVNLLTKRVSLCRIEFMLPASFKLIQFRPKDLQRLILIFQLRFLILAGDHDPRRDMCQANGGIRGIDALASVPGRAENIKPAVIQIKMHVHLLRFRHNGYRRRRGMDPAPALSFRNALHAVDAALIFQP